MQQAVDAELRVTLGSAAWAGFISYFGGTLCMLILAFAMGEAFPPAAAIFGTNWRSRHYSGASGVGGMAVICAAPARAARRVI